MRTEATRKSRETVGCSFSFWKKQFLAHRGRHLEPNDQTRGGIERKSINGSLSNVRGGEGRQKLSLGMANSGNVSPPLMRLEL